MSEKALTVTRIVDGPVVDDLIGSLHTTKLLEGTTARKPVEMQQQVMKCYSNNSPNLPSKCMEILIGCQEMP